ncbi:zinc finger protein, partial [Aphelenchoides avenae]
VLKTLKYSTTALVNHLGRHPTYKKAYDALQKEPTPKITNFTSATIGGLSVLDRRIVHFIARTHQSFNVVNDETFREKHYREVALPRVYKLVCLQLRIKLKDCPHLSFTCDIWSGTHASFISLTAHGITKKWERIKAVLAVREFGGRHTSERVREMINGLLKEWDVGQDQVHCVLHDQASNMIGAFEETPIEDADCGAHKLNLIVRNGVWPTEKDPETDKMRLKKTAVTDLLTKCRNTVSHFRHSHLAAQRFKDEQQQHDLPEHHLIQDVVTRWDSTFLMVHRFLEQRQALDAYCVQHKRELLLTATEWALLTELEKFLRPLTEFSKLLCRDSSPLSVQVAVGRFVEHELESYEGELLETECERMKIIREEKFKDVETIRTHGLSHALDPRFKDTLFTGADAVRFRNSVVDWLGHYAQNGQPVAADEGLLRLDPSSPPKKKSFLAEMRSKFTKAPRPSTSASQPASRRLDYHTEFLAYLREETLDWETDPVDYWKANEHRYPTIAPIARRFLTAPATSVTSEQTFSVANVVFDPRRSRMDARKAEYL